MSAILPTDADFKFSAVTLDMLLHVQEHADLEGWATRWESFETLRQQAVGKRVVLQALLREMRNGEIRAYRCFALFVHEPGGIATGITTIDIAPETYFSLPRIDTDESTRATLLEMFSDAVNTVPWLSKASGPDGSRSTYVDKTDPDFQICRINLQALLEVQTMAEASGWRTPWSSAEALRHQVRDRRIILRPLSREFRSGVLQAYRCLIVFAMELGGVFGGTAIVDVAPATFGSFAQIDRDDSELDTVEWLLLLASGGVTQAKSL